MTLLAQHMDAVVRHLLGEPNAALSTKEKLRYGTYGSLAIDLATGTWFDHKRQTGGGVLALIERETKCANGAAIEWLRRELGVELENGTKQIAEIYPYIDENGALLFEVVRYEPKEFRQRRPDGRGGWRWKLGDVRRVLFHLPQLIAASGRAIYTVEGEKDVLAAERLGLVSTTNPGGAGKWRSEFANYFRGADVVVVSDNDEPGEVHAKQVAENLRGVASSVRILHLPGLPPKGDISDWIRLGGTAETLVRLADSAPEVTSSPQASVTPVIKIKAGEISRITRDAEGALIASGAAIYRRDKLLLRPVVEEMLDARGGKTRVAQLTRVESAWLRVVMARAANWEKYNIRSKSWMPADPPKDITETLLSQFGEWRFPAVTGVLTTPSLRPDGTVLSIEGYDAATKLLLVAPPALPEVEPTRENAGSALRLLEQLLIEFPFANEASRSVGLSAIITPVCRAAFPVAPLHGASAPVAGAGKSFLYDIAAATSTGQLMPVMSAGRSEEELEKRLGAALLSGQPLISIDNVNGELGGDALCQAIERPIVEIRILGRSERVRIQGRGTTFYATGNNLTLTGDLCRRSIIATLDPVAERPELRHFLNDPIAMVLAHRARYISACLTIVRAYIVAGRPAPAPRLASFEGWSDTVRSALIWLDRADPCDTMESSRSLDPRLGELRTMLAVWAEEFGTGYERREKLPDVLKAIEEHETLCESGWPNSNTERVYRRPKLREAVLAVASLRGRTDAKTFGYWMRRNKGRVVGGFRFCGFSDDHGHAAEWYVEQAP